MGFDIDLLGSSVEGSEESETDDLMHYGIKGMQWGKRKTEGPKTYSSLKEAEAAFVSQKHIKSQLKAQKAKDDQDLAEAKKHPDFRREVEAAKKNEGIWKSIMEDTPTSMEFVAGGGMTARLIPKPGFSFKDSTGKEVSLEFANAVVRQAGNELPHYKRPVTKPVDSTKVEADIQDFITRELAQSDEAAIGASFADYFINEPILEHYGKKGMRWGVTTADDSTGGSSSSKSDNTSSTTDSSSSKASSSPKEGLTDGQKKALKYAAGGALLAGAILGTAILAKNGKLPIGNLRPSGSAKSLYPTMGEVHAREAKAANAARSSAMRNLTAGRLKAEGASARSLYPTMGEVDARENLARAVAARQQTDSVRRATAQANLSRAVVARQDAAAIRRVAAQENLTRRLSSGSTSDSGDSEKSSRPSAREIFDTFNKAREVYSVIEGSNMWNRPARDLSSNMSPEQRERQQIVRNQQAALQNGSQPRRN